MSKRIRLNVGGTYFETSQENLLPVPYFEALLLRWEDEDKEIFIDRSAIGFDHVLNLLRNPNYVFPRQYADELDYYGIEYKFPVDSLEELKKVDGCKTKHEVIQKNYILGINKKMQESEGNLQYSNECRSCNKSKKCDYCGGCANCCDCICQSCDKYIVCFKCRLCYNCDKCDCRTYGCDKYLACGQCRRCDYDCIC